jgi:membrane-associated HD superfamily phosphohydrolase
MRQPLMKSLMLLCFLSFILIALPQPAAHAGFFDTINDIYNTPKKIEELEQKYIEAKEAIAGQQQQLEESAKAAADYALTQQNLLKQNEQIRQQNEQLIAQNASMQAEMERMKQDRQSVFSKLINTIIIIVAVFISYIAAIRVWRYVAWRKHRGTRGRGISG